MYDVQSIIDYYYNKNYYQDSRFGTMSMHNAWTKTIVSYYYSEARRVYNLALTFDDFYQCILIKNGTYDKYYRKRYKRPESDYYYREKRGYKKSSSHKKKELSDGEIRKREWKVKVNRSKKNPNWNKKGWTYLRETANKQERRETKQRIFREDWEGFSNNPKRTYLNPWDFY